MTNLKELQKEWNTFGNINPMWAVLTSDKNWDVKRFFETGEREINNVMEYLLSQEINVKIGNALDFGCGIGRLTQALSSRFDKVYGVDISPSMIKLAKEYNKYPNKCEYILNDKDNLLIFKDNSFDFIYTNIVLQHMEPEYSLSYIKEFLRILKPEGILLFQIPSRRLISWQSLVRTILPKFIVKFLSKKIHGAIMEVHSIKREKIMDFLNKNNANIINITENKSAGGQFESFNYLVRK